MTTRFQVGDHIRNVEHGWTRIVVDDDGRYLTLSAAIDAHRFDDATAEATQRLTHRFIDDTYELAPAEVPVRVTDPSTLRVGDVLGWSAREWLVTDIDDRHVYTDPGSHFGFATFGYDDIRLIRRADTPDTPREEVKEMITRDTVLNPGDIIVRDDGTWYRRIDGPRETLGGYHCSPRFADPDDARTSTEASYVTWDDLLAYVVYSRAATVDPNGGGTTDDAHRRDMEILSRALAAEARTRGWCPDYERFVERINRDLSVPLDPNRTQRVRSTLTFEVTVERTDETDIEPTIWLRDVTTNLGNPVFEAPYGWTFVRSTRTDSRSERV